jgi:hypothetical protein
MAFYQLFISVRLYPTLRARPENSLRLVVLFAAFLAVSAPALAGPPYQTDDPEPADLGHFEIYAFTDGVRTQADTTGQSGFDINYGAAEDLQLTAVVPLGFDDPREARSTVGLSDIELGAKYRFLHQDDAGWDVSFFPQADLPTRSRAALGDGHASFFLPLWLQKDWGDWSTFGGGGYDVDRGGDSRDFWFMGWALTRKLTSALEIGVEVYHSTPAMIGGKASTGLGLGADYEMSEHYHLLASFGPGIQNAAETDSYSWYASLEFKF